MENTGVALSFGACMKWILMSTSHTIYIGWSAPGNYSRARKVSAACSGSLFWNFERTFMWQPIHAVRGKSINLLFFSIKCHKTVVHCARYEMRMQCCTFCSPRASNLLFCSIYLLLLLTSSVRHSIVSGSKLKQWKHTNGSSRLDRGHFAFFARVICSICIKYST